jgi:hypothetical protein
MRSWRRPVATIVGVTIVVDVLMIVTGMGPQVVLVAALGGLVGVAWWFLSDLADVALGTSGATAGPASAPEARPDRRVMQLRTGLAYGRPDRASLVSLRASLIELIDDQLRTVHQIDLAEDPDGARAVIGDDLYVFVDDPDSATMLTQPRNVDRILTRIEAI